MSNHVLEVRIEKVKDISVENNWIMRTMRNQIFDSVVVFMMQGFGIDKKSVSKKEREDEVQVFRIEGSKAFCEATQNKIEGIEKEKINNFIESSSKVRVLPKFVRQKLQRIKYDPNVTSYNWLIQYLMTFKILFYTTVYKKPEDK